MAANPFYDAIRQNTELSQGITERIPLRLDPAVRQRAQNELPFSWLRDIARRSDAGTSNADADEGAEALAMQFYRIELAEQRRLTGVMQHHSKHDSHQADDDKQRFPFSITAGVEKGAKNRYRNIWPFEHARVRLSRHPNSPDSDDYVNASYVQPLGTSKRYAVQLRTVMYMWLISSLGILQRRDHFPLRSTTSGCEWNFKIGSR
jgi:tyrosine-protein phosphatase 2/3